jgi:hypothetical protein
MAETKGGCLCGAVRYSAQAEPAFVIVCHCRDCQKFTGSAFATLVAFPKTALGFEGQAKTFTSTADSGRPIVRQFCPECGSSICELSTSRLELIIINAGTLDDPTSVTPAREIYCDRSLPWVQLGGNMQRFSTMPT